MDIFVSLINNKWALKASNCCQQTFCVWTPEDFGPSHFHRNQYEARGADLTSRFVYGFVDVHQGDESKFSPGVMLKENVHPLSVKDVWRSPGSDLRAAGTAWFRATKRSSSVCVCGASCHSWLASLSLSFSSQTEPQRVFSSGISDWSVSRNLSNPLR